MAGAFGMIALYGFVSAALAKPGARVGRYWLLGGIALGLAIGTRPTYVVFCLVPLGFVGLRYVRQRKDGVTFRTMIRPLTLALAPPAIVLVLFAAYNQARFGSPTDFGLTHVLSPGYNVTKIQWSSLGYTLPNSYYYLLRPFSLSPVFPFISFDSFQWPFNTPHDYAYNEPVVGILTTSPLLVLGVVVVVRGAFARRARRDDRFTVASVLMVVALITVAVVSTSIYGAIQRYRVEADVLLTAAAVVAISLAWSFLHRRRLGGCSSRVSACSRCSAWWSRCSARTTVACRSPGAERVRRRARLDHAADRERHPVRRAVRPRRARATSPAPSPSSTASCSLAKAGSTCTHAVTARCASSSIGTRATASRSR